MHRGRRGAERDLAQPPMPSSPIAVFTTLVSAVAPPRVSRRVCVIGGGSGGVIAARFLKKAGHKPKLRHNFSGVWADASNK